LLILSRNWAEASGVICAIKDAVEIDLVEAAREGPRSTLVTSEVEGLKLATLAFIVGLYVTVGLATSAVEVEAVENCGAAVEPAVEAMVSNECWFEDCDGDILAVGCAWTGCSLGGPISTFLTADLLAIRPGLADNPLASNEVVALVRPATWEVVAAKGARGTVFSSVAAATFGVGLVT
jgi:hypothetical protein